MLKKEYIRDGRNRILGSVTTGYSDTSSVIRNERDQIVGRTNQRLGTTRDENGNLVSVNSSDPGLLIGRKK
jgi:hypothetical protein